MNDNIYFEGDCQWVVGVGSRAEEVLQGPERRPTGWGHQTDQSVPELYNPNRRMSIRLPTVRKKG